MVGQVPLISAESSIILGYNDPVFGIDKRMNTSAKFVSDKHSFWYKVHFDGLYCIDQVMSLDADIYTHSWNCKESGCGTSCEGVMCKYVDVIILNENHQNSLAESSSKSCGDFSSVKIPANCGDGVKISISEENAKILDYDYFEVSEFSVTGRKQGQLLQIFFRKK